MRQRPSSGSGGFTLIEILLAVAIMSIIATVSFLSITSATQAWTRGTKMTESLHHGDYVIDQLVMGLRSAYYPQAGNFADYGFEHHDDGDGPSARDTISWVKVGDALVGSSQRFSQSPHRVAFEVLDEGEGSVAAVRAWQILGQVDDFDPDDVEPLELSRRVVGFDLKAASRDELEGDEIEWLDVWELTNQLPVVVSLTLYVEPPEEGDDPLELRRVVELPCAPLSEGK
jgi:prepilin-type N-terminal cleavage/methylation domain-containing protein